MQPLQLLLQAVALEPTNPYAHRAWARSALCVTTGPVPFPTCAWTPITPQPIRSTLYTLAQCLMALAGPGQLNETEACLNQALTLGPQTDLAESDRQTHSRLARQVLRANSGVGPLSTDTQKVLTAETKQSSLFWEVSPLVSRVAWGVGWGC